MSMAKAAKGKAEWDTIDALIRARGASDRDRLAVEVDGRPITYGELDRLSDRVAANLAAAGVAKEDRVASFAFNCVEQLLVFFGTVKLGAVWVPLNVSLQGQDLSYSIDDSAPKVLVVDAESRSRLDDVRPALKATPRIFVIGGSAGTHAFEQLLAEGTTVPVVVNQRQDSAVIIYTGGTTGLPKGVVLPHFAWIAAGIRYIEAFEIGPDDRHYSVLALYHVGGLMIGVIGPVVARIPAFIDKWFSASTFWPRVRETGATVIDPIGTMVSLLCKQSPGPQDRDHKVRVSLGALSQVPAAVAEQFPERFGLELVNVYSLSESGGVLIIYNERGSPAPKSNGHGQGWCDIRIVGEGDAPLPPGKIGEITLRPSVPYTFMLGYHNNPARTLECFRNLWLHTGDLGYVDDNGYLYFTGRQAHWLRTRGENVSAYEVEDILSAYDGIREVVIVGVPAALGEEDVKAFVIPEPGRTLDPADILRWCEGKMAPFKVPRFIEMADEFPRSATKREVERHKLRDRPNDTAWDAEKVFGRRSFRPSAKS